MSTTSIPPISPQKNGETSVEAKKEKTPEGKASSRVEPIARSIVSQRIIEANYVNSLLAIATGILSTLVSLALIVFLVYFKSVGNTVIAVPEGGTWDYPMIHYINYTDKYEDTAKPIDVALRYATALYEIDPLDFTEVDNAEGTRVYLNNRISELMGYAIPGTPEYTKLSMAFEASYTNYKIFRETRTVKRVQCTDVLVSRSSLPQLRVEILCRFKMFGTAGELPLPPEDLGYKSIVVIMINDVPAFDSSVENKEPIAENPEGWYVITSFATTIEPKDIDNIRKIRALAGMREAL